MRMEDSLRSLIWSEVATHHFFWSAIPLPPFPSPRATMENGQSRANEQPRRRRYSKILTKDEIRRLEEKQQQQTGNVKSTAKENLMDKSGYAK